MNEPVKIDLTPFFESSRTVTNIVRSVLSPPRPSPYKKSEVEMTVACDQFLKPKASGLSKFKPISNRHPILGRFLLISLRGMLFILIFAFVASFFVPSWEDWSGISINLLIFVWLPLKALTVWLIHPLAEEVIKNDPRPVVLYLRSFADEDLEIDNGVGGAERFEKFLVAEIGSRGLAIPIDIVEPGGSLHNIGPARAAFADDEWKAGVLAWMEKAQLIIFIPNATDGLCWEMEQIRDRGYLSKLLVLFPPASDKARVNTSHNTYETNRYENVDAKELRWSMVLDVLSDSPAASSLRKLDFRTIQAIHFESNGRPVVLSGETDHGALSATDYSTVLSIAVYGIFCRRS